MTNLENIFVAGSLTAKHWKTFKAQLMPGASQALWQKAFDDYFLKRLSLRYLEPIRILQANGTFQGEGFSIVAIQCTLIEFLASTVEGKNYRFRRANDPPLTAIEYSKSNELFVRFLSQNPPFSGNFDEGIAQDFYVGVRCGLLHEARTKNGWKIWAQSTDGAAIDAQSKIVFRDSLQEMLLQFVADYGKRLLSDGPLQEALIRKFDSLCD